MILDLETDSLVLAGIHDQGTQKDGGCKDLPVYRYSPSNHRPWMEL
jgi:hypothetical protein